jgi:type III restriction enzyme
MPRSIIAYDRDLPEIPDRCPWEKPAAFLVKDSAAIGGWRINETERRPSKMLLVKKLRADVDRWRDDGYPGASKVTQRLFEYWFENEHDVSGFSIPFRYHFCQREAIEALAYIVEIGKINDSKVLIDTYAEIFSRDMFSQSIEYQTTMDGRRQIRRYFPELETEGVQELPPENLRRYAFKMATGSGKTWVMAMAIVWSHFHKRHVPESNLSTNFLIVAPNIIVYQRLAKDFGSNRIFNEIPLIPPEWRGHWNQKVILRGESTEPDASSNLFLTNIHQLYESRDQDWTPENAVDALLGRKPANDAITNNRSMLERVKSLKDLVVINDEAHHVHDEDLAWNRSLLSIHSVLPKGLSLWLDFSATPKYSYGAYFPWILCDYPLAQAVEDRIVKAPLIVTKENDRRHPPEDPENVTKDNAAEKYGFWIMSAVQRWKEHYKIYKKLNVKPVLFVMAEKNIIADAIGEDLVTSQGFKKNEVLIIHTDTSGEVRKSDLEAAREAARDIDKPGNPIKAIVSVMMLREGWDVRNVSVVLGLRPFTAQAEILPEQVIGRGLRLMTGIGPDTQTLEVLGTKKLLSVLREQLEAEGVGVGSTKTDPPKDIAIEPLLEKVAYDIAIPLTKPVLTHNTRKLSTLDPSTFGAIYDQADLDEPMQITLKMEFATVRTEVHQERLAATTLPMAQELLAAITNKVIRSASLSNVFAELYPLVRTYMSTYCFGRPIDVEHEAVRSHLVDPKLQDGIARYLARKISELTVERKRLQFENARFKLSDTKPFRWRRNLKPEPVSSTKTIFNYVATYNDFERRFAQFLHDASDVLRFASLGTTEQGESGTQFRVDYLKPNGAIGFYHPDWVVVQKTPQGELNWIIETKGRVWEGTEAKDAAMHDWCDRISEQTGRQWKFCRVNQGPFETAKPKKLAQAVCLSEPKNEPTLPV